MDAEQRDDLVVRHRLGHAAVATDDALGAPERVDLTRFMREQSRTVVG
jgi:hypothetical protein